MRELIARCVVLAAIAGSLAACADKPPPTQQSEVRRGAYKVGKPYQIGGVWYYPAEDYSYDETGIASWYGSDFHGKLTANGESYDMNAVTAAHKTLPMPSFVRVTNLENGRSIVVRVNDRGPYVASRIIDLSRRSAQMLGMEGRGTAKVRVQIMADESRALAAKLKAGQPVDYADAAPPPAAAPRETVVAESLTPSPAPAPVVRPAVVRPAVEAPDLRLEAQPVRTEAIKPTRVFVQAGAFQQYDNAHRVIGKLKPIGHAAISPVRVNGGDVYRVRMGPISSVDEADKMLDMVINAGYPDARVVVD